MGGNGTTIGLVESDGYPQWLYCFLGCHYNLVSGTPDSSILKDASLLIFDDMACERYASWLASPSDTQVRLRYTSATDEAEQKTGATQIDGVLSSELGEVALRERIDYWLGIYLWRLAITNTKVSCSETKTQQAFLTSEDVPSEKDLLYALLNSQLTGVFVFDVNGTLKLINEGLAAFLACDISTLIGRNIADFIPQQESFPLLSSFFEHLNAVGSWAGKLGIMNEQKTSRTAYVEIKKITSRENTVSFIGVVGQVDNSCHLKTSMMSFDDAMKEKSSSILELSLHKAIKSAELTGRENKVALLHIHLHRFHSHNESFSHLNDEHFFLSQTQRILSTINNKGELFRLSTYHFAIVLPDYNSESCVIYLAHELVRCLAKPLASQGQMLITNPVIGISFCNQSGTTAEELMRKADTAMTWCRDNGSSQVQIFNAELSTIIAERLVLEQELVIALEKNQFLLVYHPQVEMVTGEVIGVEALIRWQNGNELRMPKDFIPFAEAHNLIMPISDWVIKSACKQAVAWQAEGIFLRVSVNISAGHFNHPSIIECIKSALSESGLAPEYLELEVTETCIMTDVVKAIETLKSLKSIGVKISVDDFGTGYSSLSYLRQFPLDKLKIDQSFISELHQSNCDAVIVRSIIALGQAMGLTVIAEGVETYQQYVYLRSLHCNEMQGYLFTKPVLANEIPPLLHKECVCYQNIKLQDELAIAPVLLLVDDEPSILSALRRTLRNKNYRIETAASAQDAVDALAHHNVGVIITDNRMPGMSGLELLRLVKERYPHVTRIMLSGYADLSSLSTAINSGEIFRFISKPWEDHELKEAVQAGFNKFDDLRINGKVLI